MLLLRAEPEVRRGAICPTETEYEKTRICHCKERKKNKVKLKQINTKH